MPVIETIELDIGKDFSTHLGTRHRSSGDYSAQEYFEDHLLPAWNTGHDIVVNLDSIEGPTPSFFEELFGGLVRKFGLRAVDWRLSIHAATNPHMKSQIREFMWDAYKEHLSSFLEEVGAMS